MSQALFKTVYIAETEFQHAKYDLWHNDNWTEANLAEIALKGSHTAAVMRNVYINYVRRRGFDAKAYWDACIIALLLGTVWQPAFADHFRDKTFKKAIAKTSFPEWTKIGIAGGSWSKIQRMLNDLEVD